MRLGSKRAMLAALTVAAASAGVVSCSAERPETVDSEGTDGDMGTLGLRLHLSNGATVNSVTYVITGPNAFARSGSLDVSNSQTISGTLSGIPSGTGYSVTLSATSTDGSTTCSGQGSFDVAAHATAHVNVNLACHTAANNGSVAVNGTLNLCPVIDGVGANPAEVFVGSSLSVSASAHDSDAGPAALSYQWTATSGSFDRANVANPTFKCTAPGAVTLNLTVSDGDSTSGCPDTSSTEVRCSVPGSGNTGGVLTVAVYGDAPYGTTPTDTSQTLATPAFIDNVNADPSVSLVLHVGDIHSGKQYCTEAYDHTVFDLWKAFQDPLVYTPGDNEWTDCHKAAEGGGTYNATTGAIDYVLSGGTPVDYASGDPLANLALVRSIFFPTPGVALGGGAKPLLSQAQYFDAAHPTDAAFVENVMWLDSQVLFAAINLPGGSNNDIDVWYGAPTATAPQVQEALDRTEADLRWLDASFAQATTNGAVGMVILWQADVWDPEKGAAHQTGYESLVQSLASHTLAFGKPVLMLNGDSHVYKTGNPLSASDPNYAMHPGYDVPNFHRLVVHGSTTPLEWLKLTVDPHANAANGANAHGPFSWQEVTVP